MRLWIPMLLLACEGAEKETETVLEVVEDADGDGFYSDDDCNDTDASINPGADEICDGMDNNCDGYSDEGVETTFYVDSDGDGFGNPDITISACELPDGYTNNGSDCDDRNDVVYPGAIEECDGFDNDCDGVVDNDLLSDFYVDSDGDGFGDSANIVQACGPDFGVAILGGDCDDANPSISPIANEVCDGLDNNCDTQVDEGLMVAYYLDFDEDGYGDPNEMAESCTPLEGYVDNTEDCDDLESYANPGMVEVCDGIDNDCDGDIDDSTSLDAIAYFADTDGDGFGEIATEQYACSLPSNASTLSGDCDDNNSLANPAMVELCDGVDNNCDGDVDEDSAINVETWYLDSDGDDYGDENTTVSACNAPANHVSVGGDCNDGDDAIFPLASEYCDGEDNDCDGDIDEGSAIDADTWYADFDEDGYGDPGETQNACSQPVDYTDDMTDCDDNDDDINPDATEVCNGEDDNCDGDIDEGGSATIWYLDFDGDGYGDSSVSVDSCTQPTDYVEDDSDCDDNDDTLLSTTLDEDCNGVLNEDEPCVSGSTSITFSYTGSDQSWVVPSDVECVLVKLWGGGGSGGGTDCGYSNAGVGGSGAFLTGTMDVTVGETLTVRVGGGGAFPGNNVGYYAGHGGGRSEIARGSTPVVIAGAGGAGPARECSTTLSHAGPGGCEAGFDGMSSASHGGLAGLGGTQSVGGDVGGGYLQGGGGTATYPNGGAGSYCGCGGSGGGGDGYYGGGAGRDSSNGYSGGYTSGGGGSSLIPPDFDCYSGTVGVTTAPGSFDSDYTGAGAGGGNASGGANGLVVIYY